MGKRVILIVGPTGAGKSTLCNALIQGVKYDDENDVYDAPPLIYDGRQMFKIGHETHSCTSTPGYYPLDQEKEHNLFLVDCPGFGDSNEFLELPNQTMIHQIVANAKAVLICVVVKGCNIDSSRGAGYLSVMTSVQRMLSKTGLSNKQLVMTLINNPNNFSGIKGIQSGIHKVIELMKARAKAISDGDHESDLINQFAGSQYPDVNELDDAAIVFENVLATFCCVDPENDLSKKFKDKNAEID